MRVILPLDEAKYSMSKPERGLLEGFAHYAHDEVYKKTVRLKQKPKKVLPRWVAPKEFSRMNGFAKLLANTELLNSDLPANMARRIHAQHHGIENLSPKVFDYILESLEKILISIDVLLHKIPQNIAKDYPQLAKLKAKLLARSQVIIMQLKNNPGVDMNLAVHSWVNGGKACFNTVKHRFSKEIKQALKDIFDGKDPKI